MAVEILAHRGLWRDPSEKNTLVALRAALAAGYGLETDIRDCDGRLVISHDPPRASALELGALLSEYRALGSTATLALNIKSDGLAAPLRDALAAAEVTNFFVFDMSIPDALHYARLELPFYARQSEHEPQVSLYNRCAGVWLDAFVEEWYTTATIADHLACDKRVCVVSPELHQREHLPLWERLREFSTARHTGLLLCTDHPQTCSEFFP